MEVSGRPAGPVQQLRPRGQSSRTRNLPGILRHEQLHLRKGSSALQHEHRVQLHGEPLSERVPVPARERQRLGLRRPPVPIQLHRIRISFHKRILVWGRRDFHHSYLQDVLSGHLHRIGRRRVGQRPPDNFQRELKCRLTFVLVRLRKFQPVLRNSGAEEGVMTHCQRPYSEPVQVGKWSSVVRTNPPPHLSKAEV